MLLHLVIGGHNDRSSFLAVTSPVTMVNSCWLAVILSTAISNWPKVPRDKFLGSDRFFWLSSICKFGSFKNTFATITRLPDLYFRFSWYKQKSDFYQLWEQHKLQKTVKMSEVQPDAYHERYIHQFQPEPTLKIH